MKRLFRSRHDRMIGGVAGGLAAYFGIDSTLMRLIWLFLLLPGGLPGIVPYVILWLLMPLEPRAADLG